MTGRELLDRLHPGQVQSESMGANTLSLAAARVAPMVVGFVFWALAALSLSPARLGLGSALLSAVLLSVQLALLGVGPATVSLLPGQHDAGRRLLSASLAAVVVTSVVVGVAVVLVTRALGGVTGAAWDSPAVVAAFLVAAVLATVAYQLDHIAVAQSSSHHALSRSLVQGLVQLGALGLGLLAKNDGVLTLLTSVAAGALASVLLGLVQQWRRGLRPTRFGAPEAKLLLRHGLPNHALMLSDRAPGYLLPLVVTAAVSATATASWYMVWMLSTAVFFVPQSAGYSLQAKLAGQGAPRLGVPQQGVSRQSVPRQGVSQQGVPRQGVPRQGVPKQGVSRLGVSQHGVPRPAPGGPGPAAWPAAGGPGSVAWPAPASWANPVRALVRKALLLSVALTAGSAVVLVVAGPVLLKLLGPVYEQGWPLLLIMAPALLVGCVTQVYYGLCRARNRLAEATAVAVVAALIAVVPAAALASQRGLEGVSLVWLAGQVVAAGLAAWRLSVLTSKAQAPQSPGSKASASKASPSKASASKASASKAPTSRKLTSRNLTFQDQASQAPASKNQASQILPSPGRDVHPKLQGDRPGDLRRALRLDHRDALAQEQLLRHSDQRHTYTSDHDTELPKVPGLRAAWRRQYSHYVDTRVRLTDALDRVESRMRPRMVHGEGAASSSLALLAAAALGLGVWGALHADVGKIGSLGVITAVPPEYFPALAAAVAGVALSLARRRQHVWVLVVQLVVLIFLLHGLDPMIHGTPRLEASYRHLGITAYIGVDGQLDTKLDAYFSWPGFFALLAMFSKATGLPSLMPLATWAPPVVNLLLLPVLLAIARRVTGHWRATWAGVWLFYLTSWVGQDYLAPQAYAYIVGLTVLAAVLAAYGGRAWKGTASKWRRVVDWMDPKVYPAPGLSRPVSAMLISCCIVMLVAMTAAHQLTPFAVAAVLLGLVAIGQLRLRLVSALAIAIPVVWLVFVATPYLVGHMDTLFGSVGNVSQTIAVTKRVSGDPGHLFVVASRIAESAFMWLAAGTGAWLLAHRHRPWLAASAAVGIPLLLLPLQPYGGELLMRVYLYSLPFSAPLLATLLLPAGGRRPRVWRTVLVAVVGLALAGTTMVTRYGNDALETFSQGELALVSQLDHAAPNGAVVIEAVHDTPWRSVKYATYKYRTLLPGKPQADAPELACSFVEELAAKSGAYLLVTQSQIDSAEMLGIGPPGAVQHFVDTCQLRDGWRVLVHNTSGILIHINGAPNANPQESPGSGPSRVGYRFTAPGPGGTAGTAGGSGGGVAVDWPGRGGGTVVLAG